YTHTLNQSTEGCHGLHHSSLSVTHTHTHTHTNTHTQQNAALGCITLIYLSHTHTHTLPCSLFLCYTCALYTPLFLTLLPYLLLCLTVSSISPSISPPPHSHTTHLTRTHH